MNKIAIFALGLACGALIMWSFNHHAVSPLTVMTVDEYWAEDIYPDANTCEQHIEYSNRKCVPIGDPIAKAALANAHLNDPTR